MTAHAREIIEEIETIAPPALAEEWDNSGLQVGSEEVRVEKVLVALTPLPEVFDEAEEVGADFLFCHHPLIFGGIDSVDTAVYPGALISHAVKKDLTVYAAHTNYDAAPNGVSVALANALGLTGKLGVVRPAGSMKKVVVFVPVDHAEALADALAGAGAGEIGDYTRCTFRTPGTGTFLPGDAADPYLGERGRLEYAEEFRIEAVVPAHLAAKAVSAAIAAHPYEEVAHDVYPVEGAPPGCGYGRVGGLPEPMKPEQLAGYVSEKLGFPARLVANPEPGRRIESLAVLGGSGGSFLREIASSGVGSGANAYVTGDLDYHDALLAGSLGLTAIDAGHAATELPSLAPFAKRLSGSVDIPVEVSRVRR